MRELIEQRYRTNPLTVIVVCGLFVRLFAAIFSEGYAFHDDHFDVTRVAQHWADGIPHWLESEAPPKHSIFYAAFNAFFLWISGRIGIEDPVIKTTILRIIHAFYSLLVIVYAYKITERLSDTKNANLVGWLLALLWFMPYLSVKFLAELVCVPPVLVAIYLILRHQKRQIDYPLQNYLFSGALLGLAFTIRMHTIFFAGALGLIMLFNRQWRASIIFTVGYLFITGIIIGIPDAIFFDYPFHYVFDYFAFNSENANKYVSGSPAKFLLTTIGFLVPPISVFLLWGFIKKGYGVSLQLFLAATIFFVFHSAFPNQQERFILPFYPLLIIVGVISWSSIKDGSRFWSKNIKLYKGLWTIFWVLNIVVALAMALTFTKKDRVAPLHYLYQKNDVTSVLIEGPSVKQPPVYYMGKTAIDYNEFKMDHLGFESIKESGAYRSDEFKFVFILSRDKTIETLKAEFIDVNKMPNYVIFSGGLNLKEREEKVLAIFPGKKLERQIVIKPSKFDRVLAFLNPRVHKNTESYIYKISDQ